VRPETPRTRTLRLGLEAWVPHLPGQHYDVRLTAPDGYQAQRSYSVASSPLEEGEIELTVDRLADGEVSPYLCDVVEPCDRLEVRGPIGGYFVWRGEAPVLLVGGGSGVVPLMAMLRHRRRAAPRAPMRLLYSVRSPAEVIYPGELEPETTLAYTRRWPVDWTGHRGRLDAPLVASLALPEGRAYVCGSHGFVETANELLDAAGYAPERILTERFGPTA
jgi:ferredoxin-NADP reductase